MICVINATFSKILFRGWNSGMNFSERRRNVETIVSVVANLVNSLIGQWNFVEIY